MHTEKPAINLIANVNRAPLPVILHYLILDWNYVLANGGMTQSLNPIFSWAAVGTCKKIEIRAHWTLMNNEMHDACR